MGKTKNGCDTREASSVRKDKMRKTVLQIILLMYLVSASAYSSFDYLNTMLSTQSFDAVNRKFEERAKNIGAKIPFSHGTIGYLSNENFESTEFDYIEYVLTQYALAPLILNRGVFHQWNILNISSEAYKIWSDKNGSEYHLVSSGEGFYLIRRLP